MKKIILSLTLLTSLCCFAQKLTNEKGEEIPFTIIEHVPVHPNCNETLSDLQLKNCINKEMRKLILKEFNTELANSLGLPAGMVKINTSFNINKEGLVDNIKIRAPHPVLKNEALRILNLIPKFKKPGLQNGKPISVAFALPINFVVDESPAIEAAPLTKKEKKALARKIKKLEKAKKRKLKRAKREAKKKQ